MYVETNLQIQELLESPNVRLIINEVNEKLQLENRNREAFYNAIDENMKAEFINGSMIVHSPVMLRHNLVTINCFNIIHNFTLKYNLGLTGIEKLMISLTRNDYEPDVCFFKKEKSDLFKPDQKLFPAPDLVVEVLSKSTETNDRNVKFHDYEAHEIEEYWIVDTDKETIEQYHLENKKYKEIKRTDDGTIKSFVVNGLKIPVRAIFDSALNFEFLQKI